MTQWRVKTNVTCGPNSIHKKPLRWVTYPWESGEDLYVHLSNTASHSSLLSPSTQGFGSKNCEDTYFYLKCFLNFHMYPTFSESLQSIYSPELKNLFEQAEIFNISEFDLVFKISAYQLNFLCVGAKFRCSRLVRWRECVGIRRGSKIWCADTFWEGLVDFFRWFWREPKSWRMPSSANYQCSLFIPQLAMFFYVRTSEHGIHAEQKSKDDKR